MAEEKKFTTSVSPEHQRAFRLFCEACDKLQNCRFLKNLRPEDGRLTWTADGGWSMTKDDEDDFRSCLVLFRKLVLEKEPTFIYSILALVGQYGNEQTRENVRELKKILRASERSYGGGNLFIGPDEEKEKLARLKSGEPVPPEVAQHFITPKELRDTIFNSGLFHEDEERESKRKLIGLFEPTAYKFLLFHVVQLSGYAYQLSQGIRAGGFLEPNPPLDAGDC